MPLGSKMERSGDNGCTLIIFSMNKNEGESYITALYIAYLLNLLESGKRRWRMLLIIYFFILL